MNAVRRTYSGRPNSGLTCNEVSLTINAWHGKSVPKLRRTAQSGHLAAAFKHRALDTCSSPLHLSFTFFLTF